MQIIYPRTPLPIALDRYDGCSKSMDELVGGGAQTLARLDLQQCSNAHKTHCLSTVWSDFPRRGGALRETTSKDRFRRALLLMKPAHTGHHPGAVPGFRPSPGNSEETTTRVLTEEISVLFRVPTWDPIHPGSPGSRALPGNTPTQGPTREGKPGFFLGEGGNPGRNPGHGLGKTRERGGFRVFPGWRGMLAPGGGWEPRAQPRSWPRKTPGTGWIPGFFRVVLLGVAWTSFLL